VTSAVLKHCGQQGLHFVRLKAFDGDTDDGLF
jgi:hypothetical protein